MALARYEPWNLLNRLHADINRTLSDFSDNGLSGSGFSGDTSAATADWVPAADVDEYEDRFELYVDLPGVAAAEVEITLHAGVLTLAGERRIARPTEPAARSRRERGTGRFYRRFILPDSVDGDRVRARERDGVLEITIPKQEAARPRRIEVAA